MKKLLLAAFAAGSLPMLVLAQGSLEFSSGGDVNAHYILTNDGITRAPNGTRAWLWWSPDNVVPYVRIGTNQVTFYGWITEGIIVFTGPATREGHMAWFYVSAATIDGQLSGRTPNFPNYTGTPTWPPEATIPPATLDGWTAPIVLEPVPEPCAVALTGLGVGALLLFRRRR